MNYDRIFKMKKCQKIYKKFSDFGVTIIFKNEM